MWKLTIAGRQKHPSNYILSSAPGGEQSGILQQLAAEHLAQGDVCPGSGVPPEELENPLIPPI